MNHQLLASATELLQRYEERVRRSQALEDARGAREAPPRGSLYLDTVGVALEAAQGRSGTASRHQTEVFDAAISGALKVIDTETGRFCSPASVTPECVHLVVAAAEIDKWLANSGASYRVAESAQVSDQRQLHRATAPEVQAQVLREILQQLGHTGNCRPRDLGGAGRSDLKERAIALASQPGRLRLEKAAFARAWSALPKERV